MPQSTCEAEQQGRKEKFKNIAARHMGICAGLEAASLTVQAGLMGPDIVANIGAVGSKIGAAGAKVMKSAKSLGNLSKAEREIKDMGEIVEVGETLTLLEKISNGIKGVGNTRKVANLIRKAKETTRLESKRIVDSLRNLNKGEKLNSIANSLKQRGTSSLSKVKDTIDNAPGNIYSQMKMLAPIETGDYAMDCVLHNYQLLNSDATCDNGNLNSAGTCAPCDQILGQHEPRSVEQQDVHYGGSDSVEGGISDINRDQFTSLHCAYGDMAPGKSWATRIAPGGICIIKNFADRDNDTNPFPSPAQIPELTQEQKDYFSPPFFVTNEYECQLTARELSSNDKPIDYGSKPKMLKMKSDTYDAELYEREQLVNNYHYYPVDSNIQVVKDPNPDASPNSPKPPDLINISMQKKGNLDLQAKQLGASISKADAKLLKAKLDKLGTTVPSKGTVTSDNFGDYTKPFLKEQKALGTAWWDSWSIDNYITDLEDNFKNPDISYVHLFKQKYKNSNVCNSDNFALAGTSMSLDNSDSLNSEKGFNACEAMKGKIPHHCCPRIINSEKCPKFQDELKIRLSSPENWPKKNDGTPLQSGVPSDVGAVAGVVVGGTVGAAATVGSGGNAAVGVAAGVSTDMAVDAEVSDLHPVVDGTLVQIPGFETNWNRGINESTSDCYEIKLTDVENFHWHHFHSSGGIECSDLDSPVKTVERRIGIGAGTGSLHQTYKLVDATRPVSTDDIAGYSFINGVSQKVYTNPNNAAEIDDWVRSHPQETAFALAIPGNVLAPAAIAYAEVDADAGIVNTHLKSLLLDEQADGSYFGTRAKIDSKVNYTIENDSGATGYEHYIDPFDYMYLEDYVSEIPGKDKMDFEKDNLSGGSQMGTDYITDYYNSYSSGPDGPRRDCSACWSFKKATRNDYLGDVVYSNKYGYPNFKQPNTVGLAFSHYGQLDLKPNNDKDKVYLKKCKGENGKCSDLEKTKYMQHIYDRTFCTKIIDKGEDSLDNFNNQITNKFYRPVGIDSQGDYNVISSPDKKKYSDICCSPIQNSAYTAFVGCDAQSKNSYFIDDIITNSNSNVAPNYVGIIDKERKRIPYENRPDYNQCERYISRTCIAMEGSPGNSRANFSDMDCKYKLQNFFQELNLKGGKITGNKTIDFGKYINNPYPINDNILNQICETDFNDPDNYIPDSEGGSFNINGVCTYLNPVTLNPQVERKGKTLLGHVPYKNPDKTSNWNHEPSQPPHSFTLNEPNKYNQIPEVYNECNKLPSNKNILDIDIHDKNIDWVPDRELNGALVGHNIRYIGSSPPDNIYDKITVKCFKEYEDNPLPHASPIYASPNEYYYDISCPTYEDNDERKLFKEDRPRHISGSPSSGSPPPDDRKDFPLWIPISIIVGIIIVCVFIYVIKKLFFKSGKTKAQEYLNNHPNAR